jgi:hypothetical protein
VTQILVFGLPAGRGGDLKRDIATLIAELRTAIPAAFDSEQYRSSLAELNTEFEERQRAGVEALMAGDDDGRTGRNGSCSGESGNAGQGRQRCAPCTHAHLRLAMAARLRGLLHIVGLSPRRGKLMPGTARSTAVVRAARVTREIRMNAYRSRPAHELESHRNISEAVCAADRRE